MANTVAIVGAAIAGPVFALHLLTHPVLRTLYRPVLFDAAAAPDARDIKHGTGASVGLFANGLYPLLNLGLTDEISKNGFEYHALSSWHADHCGSLTRLSGHPEAFYSHDLRSGMWFFERSALQALLVNRVQQLGGEMRWNARATSFKAGPDGTEVGFEDGSSIAPALLVGADGAYSAVRRHLLAVKNPATAAERWLPHATGLTGLYGVSLAPRKSALGSFDEAQLVWLDPGFLTTGPCPGGKTRWDMVLPETEKSEQLEPDELKSGLKSDSAPESWQHSIVPGRYPLSHTVRLLREHRNVAHPYAGDFEALLSTADRIIHSPLRARVWEADEIQHAPSRTVLMGDAARLMLPTSGQGTGFAIEDATVLASCLLKHGAGGIEKALEEYALLRVPRGKQMTLLTRFATKWSMGQGWGWRNLRYYASRWQATHQDVWPFNVRLRVE